MSSHSSHHPQEVLLAQFSLYVHKDGLKPDSFHFIFRSGRQVDKPALLFSSASLLLHLAGRSALLFPSDYLLLDLVGRSASRHFSSASLLPHLVGRSAGWHFSSHLLGLRPPGHEFRILCLEDSVISFISPSSGGSPGAVQPICAQRWPKARFISFHF